LRGLRGARITRGINDTDYCLDRHSLAFGNLNFFQYARRGGRNFRVYFVGGNFKQGLVALHLIAGLLEPLGNGAFKYAFAHLRHYDVYGHVDLLWKPVSSWTRDTAPINSFLAGSFLAALIPR
jgi:hypothetical protein